jgi:hypothetical protein
MSLLDPGLAIDIGAANPTKQTSQEYGDEWISEWAYNMQAMPIFQPMSRDSRTGNSQTASSFTGQLIGVARRARVEHITVRDLRREALVKIVGKIPTLSDHSLLTEARYRLFAR